MNQQIIDYLTQHKDQYPQESLVAQLQASGYTQDDIDSAVVIVYGENKQQEPPQQQGTEQKPIQEHQTQTATSSTAQQATAQNQQMSAQEYIRSELSSGKSREEVFQNLLGRGWTLTQAQNAFALADGSAQSPQEAAEKSQQNTITIVLTIGAVFVGIGIFSFIAANWSDLSDSFRVILILGAMSAAYGLGWFLREYKDFHKTGTALLFLGAIIYGAGVFLIGQIFNVRAEWPDGFMIWMLGVLPVAYMLKDIRFYGFAAAVGMIGIMGYPFAVFLDAFGGPQPFLLTSAFLLILSTAASTWIGFHMRALAQEAGESQTAPKNEKKFHWIFFVIFLVIFWPIALIYLIYYFGFSSGSSARVRQFTATSESYFLLAILFLGGALLAIGKSIGIPVTINASVLLTALIALSGAHATRARTLLVYGIFAFLSWWTYRAALWADDDTQTTAIIAGLAFLSAAMIYGGSFIKKTHSDFARIYTGIGATALIIVLFFFSTKIGLRGLEEMMEGDSFLTSWQLLISLVLFGAMAVISGIAAMGRRALSFLPLVSVGIVTGLFALIALLPEMDLFSGKNLEGFGILLAIIFNALIIGAVLGIIFYGYQKQSTTYVTIGVWLSFALIIVKYFDWFFSFLDKSIFFTTAGILLLVVGWFMERTRKKLISQMNTQQ